MKARSGRRAAAVFAVAVMTVFGTAGAAEAANNGVGKVKVGSAKEIGSSAIFDDVTSKERVVVRVVGRFSNHTSSSVKLTSFRICFSDSQRTGAWVRPIITVMGKSVWNGGATRHVASGSCTSWYSVNKTFKKKSGGELLVVKTDLGFRNWSTLNGFYR